MKLLSAVIATLAVGVAAHSWVDCVDAVVEGPGKAYYKAHPPGFYESL
jgi:hypothetical protein